MERCKKVSADLFREKQINRILREIVFPKLESESNLNIIWLNNEKVLDRKGIDIMLDGAYVDIKAHMTEDAAMPKRFSFELKTRHRTGDSIDNVTEASDGWLISKRKVTEKYLFCYYKMGLDRKISVFTLVLIDREKLIKALIERGLDINESITSIRNKSYKIVVQPNGSVKYYFPKVWDVSLTHSLQLPEQPLNIIVKSEVIFEICDWSYTIDFPSGVPLDQ